VLESFAFAAISCFLTYLVIDTFVVGIAHGFRFGRYSPLVAGSVVLCALIVAAFAGMANTLRA